MIIRQAVSGDADAIATILSKSFLEETAVIRISIENNPRYSLTNMYIAEDKRITAGIAGCLRITPFEVYTRGVRMPMAGIAAVAVQPEARRHGIAEALMEDALRKMYEMDFPISMLFPFKHDFYKKFGYGYVGNIVHYDFSPNNISANGTAWSKFPSAPHSADERFHVRAFSKIDKSKLKRVLQQEIQANGSFAMLRNDNFWDLVVFPKFKDAYVYDDGEVKGYIVFETYKEHLSTDGLVGETVLNIKELVGLDAAAHRGLWGFVGSLGEQITRVKFSAPLDYPLHLFLKEPRELDYRRLFFEYKSFSRIASGFMLRVINVPAAIGRLHHAIESPSDIVIKVNDGNLPQNSRTFNLHVHNGETVVDETKQNVQFETSVEAFSQIYSGFVKPTEALRFGFAQGERAIGLKLDDLFKAPAPFVYQYDIF